MLRRPTRQFRPWSLELEGRRLLTTVPTYSEFGDVGFVGQGVPQAYLQQDGPINLQLYRDGPQGALQVRVTATPSSPDAAGVVGPLNQIITLPDGGNYVPITVPVNPGAPNSGEADVILTITPINPPPHLTISKPMELRIFASDDAIPPQIVSAQGTPQGIVVTFSKPMDPAGASNVNNYA
jgi:hypothetical protein